ncbi:MAG: hypothetical protein B6244_10865 [Candidatus Cloacimonetes bacterium 4572_55]|nr:MAG: hypothetical protein B6244_10865 [Candidatus Cloacimonetes bacterium 4572_55]
MRRQFYIVLLIILSVFAGCSNDSGDPDYREELVIFGYLFVDEAVTPENAIFVGKTLPIDEYYEQSRSALSGAIVQLENEDASESFLLTEEDPQNRPGFYSNSDVVIESQTHYRLTVETADQSKSAFSQTFTPYLMEMIEEPSYIPKELIFDEDDELLPTDTVPDSLTMVFDDIPDYHRIVFRCSDPTEEQICLVDIYCLEKWQDAHYIYVLNDHDQPEDEEEYEGQGSEEPRHTMGYLRLENFDEENGDYVFNWYGGMFAFWGRYELGLYTIDDNYYNFLYKTNPEQNSGIEGGIGVFGSACRQVYYLKIKE